MGKIEHGEYLIPVSNTHPEIAWLQKSEIPTTHLVLEVDSGKFNYLRFVPLGIEAGGWPNEPMEIVEHRIRAQMLYRLETAEKDSVREQLYQYFCLKTDLRG